MALSRLKPGFESRWGRQQVAQGAEQTVCLPWRQALRSSSPKGRDRGDQRRGPSRRAVRLNPQAHPGRASWARHHRRKSATASLWTRRSSFNSACSAAENERSGSASSRVRVLSSFVRALNRACSALQPSSVHPKDITDSPRFASNPRRPFTAHSLSVGPSGSPAAPSVRRYRSCHWC